MTLDDMMAELPPERREAIEARTVELLAEVKAEMLADPMVVTAYELGRVQAVTRYRHPGYVRRADRRWRAKERAANLTPLSDKIVYPHRLVDAPPPPKKGRGK